MLRVSELFFSVKSCLFQRKVGSGNLIELDRDKNRFYGNHDAFVFFTAKAGIFSASRFL